MLVAQAWWGAAYNAATAQRQQQGVPLVRSENRRSGDSSQTHSRPRHSGHGVCGIVKAVDELEAKCDQQRNEEQEKRCVACDFCAAFSNVVIDAVGDVQHHGLYLVSEAIRFLMKDKANDLSSEEIKTLNA